MQHMHHTERVTQTQDRTLKQPDAQPRESETMGFKFLMVPTLPIHLVHAKNYLYLFYTQLVTRYDSTFGFKAWPFCIYLLGEELEPLAMHVFNASTLSTSLCHVGVV